MTNTPLDYDPDFDEPLHSLHPRVAFYAGVVTAILGISTIGFFVLLVLFLKGGITAR